ncbi:DUF3617 domain-containing protein [Methylobacterium nigriterrae]|uniref:DUF3617 domain-containing protein n=1 Tax=Methylobacterium nigriterrae TaxID=3127512 RepID=UPI0030138AFE
MPRTGPIEVGCLALLLPAPVLAAGPAMPESGSYEVEVTLELPHLDDMTARKVTRLCLTSEAGANNHGIAVLSDNNPLSGCPISNRRRNDNELTFDIACAGRNAARATARYVLAPTAFRGRIAMQMGGKNMTMTEVQAGHRVGACPGAEDVGKEAGKTPAP